jgi:hypothetical protein
MYKTKLKHYEALQKIELAKRVKQKLSGEINEIDATPETRYIWATTSSDGQINSIEAITEDLHVEYLKLGRTQGTPEAQYLDRTTVLIDNNTKMPLVGYNPQLF